MRSHMLRADPVVGSRILMLRYVGLVQEFPRTMSVRARRIVRLTRNPFCIR